jgi:hypothetical protein
MTRIAGSVSLVLGLGFGLPCVFAIRHFAQTGEVWTLMGFPTYGDGPFERIGVQISTALLVACWCASPRSRWARCSGRVHHTHRS